jgi:hypothetical protein
VLRQIDLANPPVRRRDVADAGRGPSPSVSPELF